MTSQHNEHECMNGLQGDGQKRDGCNSIIVCMYVQAALKQRSVCTDCVPWPEEYGGGGQNGVCSDAMAARPRELIFCTARTRTH